MGGALNTDYDGSIGRSWTESVLKYTSIVLSILSLSFSSSKLVFMHATK